MDRSVSHQNVSTCGLVESANLLLSRASMSSTLSCNSLTLSLTVRRAADEAAIEIRIRANSDCNFSTAAVTSLTVWIRSVTLAELWRNASVTLAELWRKAAAPAIATLSKIAPSLNLTLPKHQVQNKTANPTTSKLYAATNPKSKFWFADLRSTMVMKMFSGAF